MPVSLHAPLSLKPTNPFRVSANRASYTYLMRSDSVTAVGAVVVGLLGNLYSRLIGGQAYPAMVPGVLFLVPVRIVSILDLPQLKLSPPSPVFHLEAQNHTLGRTSQSEFYKVGAL